MKHLQIKDKKVILKSKALKSANKWLLGSYNTVEVINRFNMTIIKAIPGEVLSLSRGLAIHGYAEGFMVGYLEAIKNCTKKSKKILALVKGNGDMEESCEKPKSYGRKLIRK